MSAELILGGTFDPPHINHFYLFKALSDLNWIERIDIVPAYQNPDKAWSPFFDYDTRVNMLTETIKDFGYRIEMGMSKIHIDQFFKNRKGPSYILDYINHRTEKHNSLWVYLPNNLSEWSRNSELLSTGCNFLSVFPPNNTPILEGFINVIKNFNANFLIIRKEPKYVNICSTLIRNQILNNDRDLINTEFLCPFVIEEILKRKESST
jgi:nicotinic acid mononucleotide adenylyltransferase